MLVVYIEYLKKWIPDFVIENMIALLNRNWCVALGATLVILAIHFLRVIIAEHVRNSMLGN